MKVVSPDQRTTLVLNKWYEAFNFCTARAALRHMITGRVRGIDASGAVVAWDTEDGISWSEKNLIFHDDQPVLRSSPRLLGKTVAWYIPTIIICNESFSYRARNNKKITLSKLYKIYKGKCQYCLKKLPIKEMTKDHHYPKSKGGSNHDFNLVLACKPCNNKKGDIFPYYDIEGNLVKPKKLLPGGVFEPDTDIIRPEWEPFIFTKKVQVS